MDPDDLIEKTLEENLGESTEHENITYEHTVITSGTVAVSVNGEHTADIPINHGIATYKPGLYPIKIEKGRDLDIKYAYKKAYADATIPYAVYAEAVKKCAQPCELAASLEFSDEAGIIPNGAIDAAEESIAKVTIKNTGQGAAYSVVLVGLSDNESVPVPGRTLVGDIEPGKSKLVEIKIKGDVKTTDGTVKLKFYAEEERGYGSNTEIRQVKTVAMAPTGLEIVSHRILDSTAGHAKGNGNGIPENGETFEVEVFVRNTGKGEARGVSISGAENQASASMVRDSAVLGDIPPGQTVTAKLVAKLDRQFADQAFKLDLAVADRFNLDTRSKTFDIPVRIQKPLLTMNSRTSGSNGAVIRNGEIAFIDLSIANRAGIAARGVKMGLGIAEDGPSIQGDKTITLGDISPNEETNPHRIRIAIPRTYQGKGIALKVRLTQQEFDAVDDIAVVSVNPSRPQLKLSWQVLSGMAGNSMPIGRASRFKAVIENQGEIPAVGVMLSLASEDNTIFPHFPDNSQEKDLKTLPPHSSMEQDFLIMQKKRSDAKLGEHQISVKATQKDFAQTSHTIAFSTVDFENFEQIAAQQQKSYSGAAVLCSPPMVWVSYPAEGMTIHDDIITLQGYAHDDKGVSRIEVRLNGELVFNDSSRGIQVRQKKDTHAPADNRFVFTHRLPLSPGNNTIEVSAWDADNLEAKETVTVSRSQVKSEIWAAVIGINDYRSDAIPDLKYAVSDARAVYDYLQSEMKIPRDHIFNLYDEQADKKNVERVLGDVLPKKVKPQDTVIIYYSGHGAPAQDSTSADGDGITKYLLTCDTDTDNLWSTAMPMERVRTIFSRLSSERVVFLADTCYSGASGGRTLSSATRATLSDAFLDRLSAGRGRVIMTASGPGELAREDKKLGNGHGVFTYYLLEGLQGAADSDRDGLITTGEAYEYVYSMVTKHTKNQQHPVKKGEEERPIILGMKR
ncbi:MAG: caspase family protein [Deltaproteobacteria bacterium]|nr:caspase family protein [Deltaproteobacteria bacterium]